MKNLSKKVILGIFSLILVATILGTSTYAWFTIGDTVAVNEFEVKVQGGVGLEFTYVDKDGNQKGYVSRLTEADLKNYLSADYGYASGTFDYNFKLSDFTSTDGVNMKKLNSVDYSLEDADKEQGFIEFKLRFRTKETESAVLVWSNGDLFNSTGIDTWVPGNPFDIPGESITIDPNASGYGAYTYFSSHAARLSVTGTVNSNVTTKVFELPAGYVGGSSSTATRNYKNTVLSHGQAAGSEILGLSWNAGALEYFHKAFGLNSDDKSLNDIYKQHDGTSPIVLVKTFQSFADPEIHISDFVENGSLEPGYKYAEVVVRVYIEGFDAEAFDGVLENELKAMLEFKFKLK